MEELVTVRDAARILGTTPQNVYEAIREGRLSYVTILGKIGVRREDLLAYQKRTANVGPHGGRPRTRRPKGRPRKTEEAKP